MKRRKLSKRKIKKIERTVANDRSYKRVVYNRFLIFAVFKQCHHEHAEVSSYEKADRQSYPKHIFPPFCESIARKTFVYTVYCCGEKKVTFLSERGYTK